MAHLNLLTHDESDTSPAEDYRSREPVDAAAVNELMLTWEEAADSAIAFFPREMTEAEKDRCRADHFLLYEYSDLFVAYIDELYDCDGVERLRRIIVDTSADPYTIARIAADHPRSDRIHQSFIGSPNDGLDPIIPD